MKEVMEREASIEESMGFGYQILNRLMNVRKSVREEESAENRIRHYSSFTRLLGDLHQGWNCHSRD
jgi:hypothetical protein